ncbi:hypothetical protein [Amycolatopsis orientalis]|uniref:hypothetical protein n=1 Tax=Amycolatopsis orientalis TaxID=31958 RepID=UPI00131A0CDE|nr:hypothetical protein [Amycolatopsis orientalis]
MVDREREANPLVIPEQAANLEQLDRRSPGAHDPEHDDRVEGPPPALLLCCFAALLLCCFAALLLNSILPNPSRNSLLKPYLHLIVVKDWTRTVTFPIGWSDRLGGEAL